MLNEFLSVILQVGLFTLIPFIFFLFRKDKSVSFSKYIGFYKPTSRSIYYSVITVAVLVTGTVGVIYVDEDLRGLMMDPNSISGKLRLMGLHADTIVILLLTAVFKTAMAEEILFRGLLAKRLISGLGFNGGNLLQALIFGLIHLLLFWKLVGAAGFPLIFIFVFSTFAGWMIGLVNEKIGNGSIIPGWVAHGLGNLLSYTIFAFLA